MVCGGCLTGLSHFRSNSGKKQQSEGGNVAGKDKSQVAVETSEECAKPVSTKKAGFPESIGVYQIVNGVIVKESLETDSATITELFPSDCPNQDLVRVLEIKDCGDRVRARIEDPPGWISIINRTTGMRFAVEAEVPQSGAVGEISSEAIGIYQIVSGVLVKESLETDSAKISELFPTDCPSQDLVRVLEVKDCGDRVRARIENPPGWISIFNKTTGTRFAVKVRSPQSVAGEIVKEVPRTAPLYALGGVSDYVPSEPEVVAREVINVRPDSYIVREWFQRPCLEGGIGDVRSKQVGSMAGGCSRRFSADSMATIAVTGELVL